MAHSFHPYPIVAFIRISLTALALTALLFVAQQLIDRIFIVLIAAVWLLSFAFILIAYISSRLHTITLDENTITYRSGMLAIRRVVLPYSRITEASYTQSLLQRVLDVGTLYVDTAGGSAVAIYVNDIKQSDLVGILKEVNDKCGKGDGT